MSPVPVLQGLRQQPQSTVQDECEETGGSLAGKRASSMAPEARGMPPAPSFIADSAKTGGSNLRAGWSIMSKTTNKFSPEVSERAVRLVFDKEGQHGACWQATSTQYWKLNPWPRTDQNQPPANPVRFSSQIAPEQPLHLPDADTCCIDKFLGPSGASMLPSISRRMLASFVFRQALLENSNRIDARCEFSTVSSSARTPLTGWHLSSRDRRSLQYRRR